MHKKLHIKYANIAETWNTKDIHNMIDPRMQQSQLHKQKDESTININRNDDKSIKDDNINVVKNTNSKKTKKITEHKCKYCGKIFQRLSPFLIHIRHHNMILASTNRININDDLTPQINDSTMTTLQNTNNILEVIENHKVTENHKVSKNHNNIQHVTNTNNENNNSINDDKKKNNRTNNNKPIINMHEIKKILDRNNIKSDDSQYVMDCLYGLMALNAKLKEIESYIRIK
ncbi:AN1-type zinc finger and UBX domain-containing protein DDB_G0268260-like isoform X2 [Chelonus insularis]|uniref:AN1-type zinc finger and UBX domain-containing protein DDB_G0268260-like isoform X2 n=1 Tax=Chelonus insularis TaxID=460826 RepID=UPI00158A4BA7|nr:AN1-type zinc finger and UBX domain-containing protein DDB_G0268260-like isoform X2 [Chelonus insularis]